MTLQRHAQLSSAFILAVAGLAACEESYTLGDLGDQPVLSGQIEAWDYGPDFVLRAGVPESTAVLAWAPIDATGKFTLVLPSSATVAPYLFMIHTNRDQPFTQPGCSGSLRTDPQDFGMAALRLTAARNDKFYSVEQAGDIAGSHVVVSYYFLDRDMTQTGGANCDSVGGNLPRKIVINNHYKVGWNSAVSITSTNQEIQTVTGMTGPVPDGVKWTSKLKIP